MEAEEQELINFLKSSTRTVVASKEVEKMKHIKNELSNIVKDVITAGKKQTAKLKEKKASQVSIRSPRSPKSPRRAAPKKQGSIRKLFSLIHGYDDDEVMDAAMDCSNSDGDAMHECDSDYVDDYQLERDIMMGIANDCLINYDDLVFGQKLGEGAYAEVFEGTIRRSDVPAALQQQLNAQVNFFVHVLYTRVPEKRKIVLTVVAKTSSLATVKFFSPRQH
jgi:hypothetical protein